MVVEVVVEDAYDVCTTAGSVCLTGPDNPPPAPAGTPASLFAGHYVQRETDPTEYYFWVVHRETGEKQLAAIVCCDFLPCGHRVVVDSML